MAGRVAGSWLYVWRSLPRIAFLGCITLLGCIKVVGCVAGGPGLVVLNTVARVVFVDRIQIVHRVQAAADRVQVQLADRVQVACAGPKRR